MDGPSQDVSCTAFAPTMPVQFLGVPVRPPGETGNLPAVGKRIGDFQLLGELGRGGIGVVFLARQVSLDRQVALKVAANLGAEARTMASLEHRHIVQVFSETVQPENNLRLLCMQYVPGATLEKVIRQLAARGPHAMRGSSLLEIVDRAIVAPALFDPDALRDRERLRQSDGVETVCWIGARLAEALAYAHRQGVLHRDIKPANILVDPYGHPRLADFNLASRTMSEPTAQEELFGGTLHYMAPEHLDAFNPHDPAGPEVVDERSDIYSLGVVLFEMLVLRLPHAPPSPGGSPQAMFKQLADQRRAKAASLRQELPDAPEALDRTVKRCLDPDPTARFQSGQDLAQALDGCLELRRMENALPQPGLMTRAAIKKPFLCATLLAVIPHLIGSAVNIAYNRLRIDLNPNQQTTFDRLVIAYNLIIYPICVWAMLRYGVVPVLRTWRALDRSVPVESSLVDTARKMVLTWPLWAALLACIGWFPGVLFFPLGLRLFSGPVSWNIASHLVISICLSGLIGLTYSFVGVQFIALRVFYPRLWGRPENLQTSARVELSDMGRRLRVIQILAGLIPLCGASLLVGVGPQEFSGSEYRTYQWLVIALIGLGLAGFQLAMTASKILAETVGALTGRVGEKLRRGMKIHHAQRGL